MAAPPNDLCANAILIPSLPWTVTIDTTQATDDPETPDESWGSGSSYNGVWYKWTAPLNLTVLDVTMLDDGNEGDLSMFVGECGGLTIPDNWAGGYSRSYGGGRTERNEEMIPGQLYYLLVTSYDPGGVSALTITLSQPQPSGMVCITFGEAPPPVGSCAAPAPAPLDAPGGSCSSRILP